MRINDGILPVSIVHKAENFSNARVALVGPSTVTRDGTVDSFLSTPSFPIGINAVYGEVKEDYSDVRVFDPSNKQALDDLLEYSRGEKVILATSPTHETLENDVYLIERVRNVARDVFTVVGGIEASIYPEFFLGNEVADLIFRGPTEKSFHDFLRFLSGRQFNSLSSIPGILFLEDGLGRGVLTTGKVRYSSQQFEETMKRFPWDSLSLPELVSSNGYELKFPTSFLLCKGGCSFCAVAAYKGTFQKADRMISISRGLMVDRLVAVSQILKSGNVDPGRVTFYLQDDDGMTDIRRLENLASDIIAAKGTGVLSERSKFSVKARFGAIDEKLYALLEEAGFSWLGLGLEHYDEDVLSGNGISKGISLLDVDRTLDVMLRHNIRPIVFTILFPLEATPKSIRGTLNQISRMNRLGCVVKARVYTSIYPGTKYYRHLETSGTSQYAEFLPIRLNDHGDTVDIPWIFRPANPTAYRIARSFDEFFPKVSMGGLLMEEGIDKSVEILDQILNNEKTPSPIPASFPV